MRLRTLEHTGKVAARAGFTLMELLVVVAILLVLIGVAAPVYFKYLDTSKINVARADAVRLAGELKNYYVAHSRYPEGEPMFDMMAAEGFLEKLPLDPWNNPYQWGLRPTGFDGTTMVPVVWSNGPNGQDEGGQGDDITSL